MPLLRIDDLQVFFPGLVDLPARAAPSTVAQYQRDLQCYVAFCDYDIDTARDPTSLRRWRVWMVDCSRLSPNTINRRLASIKTLAKLSAQHPGVDTQQAYNFHFVEPVKVRALKHRLAPHAQTWLEPDEVRKLWRVADPTTLTGVRDRALIAVLAASGCRIGEVVTLKREQIRWKEGQGYLEVIGKAQVKARMAPFTEEAYQWVERWLKARAAWGVEAPLIFTQLIAGGKAPIKTPLSRHGAYMIIKRCAQKAGLFHVKPHDLRRFVGNALAEEDIRQAQLALGHVNLETTTLYVRNEQRMFRITEGRW
jgi:site-specific recombinase XerD